MDHAVDAADHGLAGRLLDWLRARARRNQELANLSRTDLDCMAADLGVTQADLMDVLPRAADNTVQMDRMMQARGLDPDRVRRQLGALVRDMELACTRCHATGRCSRDLRAGIADQHCHAYCANADAIDALLAATEPAVPAH